MCGRAKEEATEETGSTTVVLEEEVDGAKAAEPEQEPTVKLKLSKKDSAKKSVNWTEETVDNEGLGRKKSKCCCIYVKPKRLTPGEPAVSSDEDSSDGEECRDCSGHHGKDVKGAPPNGGDRREGGGEGAAGALS